MADLTAMLQAAAGAAVGEYQISRSLRFNSADSAYLERTPASAGNRKTWTWSGWVKRSALGNQFVFGAGNTYFAFGSDDTIEINLRDASTNYFGITSAVYRDVSAWYHIVIVVDTTQATAANRLKVYVNGVQITSFGTSTYTNLAQDSDLTVNNTVAHEIGKYTLGGTYFSGYLTEINFIDGSALTPTSFGEINEDTGVWSPIAYAGSYGTNGFYLNFSDNSGVTSTTLGKDQAGSNNWTPNNFSVTAGAGNDSLVDTPTRFGTDTGAGGEVRGNYCTLNYLMQLATISVLQDGNLELYNGSGGDSSSGSGTIAITSGKWYWEVLVKAIGNNNVWIGISQTLSYRTRDAYQDILGYNKNGEKVNNGASGSAYGATYTTNDVIGIAYDADAGTLVFYKNGSSQGTAFSGLSLSGGVYPRGGGDPSSILVFNFGQRPFAYTAPSGFKALVTTNLPDPTVVQGDEYFNTVLYTGDRTNRTITVGFQPDFVWVKSRNAVDNHYLMNSLSGVGKYLLSDGTAAEATNAPTLTAFDSTGFSVGNTGTTNETGRTYASWSWKGGGAGVSNTDGTITSTVSASIDSGFSVVTYAGNGSAGATVGHGLGAAPAMIIVKNRDQADAWQVYHAANTANPETDYLVLNTTAATADALDRWNDTAPTSSVFSLGDGVEVNTNTEDYVAYCFADVEGFSKFGSYTGNGSADGPFVFLGFRPKFIMLKNTTTAGNAWHMIDTVRGTYNVYGPSLDADAVSAEITYTIGDVLSNGFKLRDTNQAWNKSNDVYVYMAFAENPFKFALAR